ncbi:MAG: flagellin [Pseudomonadota bacterium]
MTQPIGDLAQFFATRTRVSQAQAELQRTTGEVSSGIKDDIGASLKGDFSRLAAVERGLRLTESYVEGANLANSYFAGMQSALERAQSEVVELGPRLIAASGTGQTAQLTTTAIAAEDGFGQVVAALNAQIGGRSAFAGIATNVIALTPADDILADLETALLGVVDAATMITIVDSYFTDPGGGYETTAYQGSATPRTGFTIGEGDVAESQITALDPAIRRTLSGLAMASLLSRGVGPFDAEGISELGRQAGEWMQEGYDATTDLRSGLGVVEARVENALTRHRATQTALGIDRTNMVNTDPFEAAIELQAAETQLETLFLMTARLQRLTLAEYL